MSDNMFGEDLFSVFDDGSASNETKKDDGKGKKKRGQDSKKTPSPEKSVEPPKSDEKRYDVNINTAVLVHVLILHVLEHLICTACFWHILKGLLNSTYA